MCYDACAGLGWYCFKSLFGDEGVGGVCLLGDLQSWDDFAMTVVKTIYVLGSFKNLRDP